jgi:hypothetical protein
VASERKAHFLRYDAAGALPSQPWQNGGGRRARKNTLAGM